MRRAFRSKVTSREFKAGAGSEQDSHNSRNGRLVLMSCSLPERLPFSENEKVPAKDMQRSLFGFKSKVMKTAQALHLQYDRVGDLEGVESRAQRLDTAYQRPINGVDNVSRERPFSNVSSRGLFRGNHDSGSLAKWGKYRQKPIVESESQNSELRNCGLFPGNQFG